MSDHPRALLEISNEIHAVFMPANTTFIVQLRNQEIILTYKLYYLRNTFWKAVAAIDSDSSNGPGQSNFSKTFAILNAIKNNCDTWAEAKIWTSARGWKKLIPSPVGDFEGLKTSGGDHCRFGGNSKKIWSRNGAWRCVCNATISW